MNQPLAGRVALVTGGGRGIGQAAARELARLGASVAVLARSASEVQATVEELRAQGARALALSADVAIAAEAEQAVAEAVRQLGPVDVLVNNAAILGPINPTVSSDPALWRQTIAVNLLGAYTCIRAVLPDMLTRGWGRIVQVSSGAAMGSGMRNLSAYSVSKAGMDMLTYAIATEIPGDGVTINGVYPGVVDTAMQAELRAAPEEHLGQEGSARFRGLAERGELVAPEDSARLIVAMVLSTLNGQILRIGSEEANQLIITLP